MDFLDKLYESNYFGIGLFAVISFLVVTFLVVLFFGKRDEKRRKLESMDVASTTNKDDLFKETSESVPVEVPVAPVAPVMPTAPIAPVIPEMGQPVINETPQVVPVAPINYAEAPVTPVAPVSYEQPTVSPVPPIVEPVIPIMPANEVPIINEPVSPVIPTPAPQVIPAVEPIRLEPTSYTVPAEPKVMEPIKINIPEEPMVQPREERPVVTPAPETRPRIVEPVVNGSYYKPVEEVKAENEEIKVPSIDFDALAKSISEELDELEKSSNNREEVKVTPMNEVTSRPANQFSSVYVNNQAPRVEPKPAPKVDLPKPIDLPTKKDGIEPESYNI